MCEILSAIDLLREKLGFIDPDYPPGGNLKTLQEELHDILDRILEEFWRSRIPRRTGRDLDELIARIEGFDRATHGKKRDIVRNMLCEIHTRISELSSYRPAI